MKQCHRIGWALALTIIVPFAKATAAAGPDECLSLRGNAEIAACAHQFAPGTPSARARPTIQPAQTGTPQVRRDSYRPLQSVAVVRTTGAESQIDTSRATSSPDRAWLTDTVIAGAVGTLALILVALAIWRRASTLYRACRYCGGRLSREARACRQCFRAV